MGKGIAWIVGVAALVVLAAFWMSDSPTDSESSDEAGTRVAKRAREERSAGSAARAQRPGTRSRGSGEDSVRSDDETDRGATRRRRPAGLADGTRGGAPDARARQDPDFASDSSRRRGQIAGGGAAQAGGGGITRPRLPRGEDDSREPPQLPEASDQPAGEDDGDVEAAVSPPPEEPIREVAYVQDPDRLFDTGVPMEVQGAGRISPDAGTVSFWIQPEWAHNREDSADLMRLGESGLQIIKEGSFLRFEYLDPSGSEQGGDADIGHWQDGEWHHVIATWTRDGMFLYVDGGQAFANQGLSRPPAQSDPRLFVGSAYPEGTGIALAAMANLTVLNRTTSQEDIMKMFQANAPTRK